MIIIREIFIAKPGKASTLAKMFKGMKMKGNFRVLTDFVSDFNQVILETEFKDLAEFEARMKSYTADEEKQWKEKMKGYHDLYLTGRREVLRVFE
ncbi:MAG: hypothetical protein PHV93_03150 [Candidatus Pacebacteria bacterium]|nr:hypothetical protein [Candidatus Paceibacterota bacterium]